MSGSLKYPLSEHMLKDYADEAREKGRLSSGKVANLLGEVWHQRLRADGLQSRLTQVQQEAARLREEVRALKSEAQSRESKAADRGSVGLPW